MNIRDWIFSKPAGDRTQAIADLASSIPISQSAVRHWISGLRAVPPKHCVAIETATGGAVTRYDLRRDVFGLPPEQKAA